MVEFSLTNFNVRLDISSLNYPDIHVHVASNSNLGGLLGHDGLQMTSEVTSDLKIELSDLDYLCFHVSLACKGFLEMIQMTMMGQISSIDEHCTLVKIQNCDQKWVGHAVLC